MQLSDCGHRFAAGTRLRIAVSTAYWPVVWPSPERTTVTIVAGSSSLLLPVRPKRPEDAALAPFAEPEAAPRLRKTQIKPGWEQRTITEDRVTGETVWELSDSDGTYCIDDIDLTVSIRRRRRVSIHPDDPGSARAELEWHRAYSRGTWRVSAESSIVMTGSRQALHLRARMDAAEGDSKIFSREWDEKIPRDLV